MNLASTPDSEIHLENQSPKTKINIPTPWQPEKGKVRLKTTVVTRKNHAINSKRTIHQHAKPCMSKPTRKSHTKGYLQVFLLKLLDPSLLL